MAALVSGSIDACNFVDLKTEHLLERNWRVRLLVVAGKVHYSFPMRMDVAPFNDIDVRTANEIRCRPRADGQLDCQMATGRSATISRSRRAYRFYDPDLTPKAYDPDKAKFYLKKAGHEGLAVELYVSETPFAGATDAAVLYSAQAAKAGINVKVIKTPEDGYLGQHLVQEALLRCALERARQ